MRTRTLLGLLMFCSVGCGNKANTHLDLGVHFDMAMAIPSDLAAGPDLLSQICTADGGSLTTANDPRNCGACGHACAAGQACVELRR